MPSATEQPLKPAPATHDTAEEKARIASILGLLPRNRKTVLDVGVNDGYITRMLPEYFESVTALDLEKPAIPHERITCVKGDATALQFSDRAFDTVFCAEVLEHIPTHLLAKACSELTRVARHEVVLGVPYRQDIRLSQTTCQACHRINPAWGHVNVFDEDRLTKLFSGLKLARKEFVCMNRERTNAAAVWLMNAAGNPYGSYEQGQPCIHCGQRLMPPQGHSLLQRICAKVAVILNTAQRQFVAPQPSWIHVTFVKTP